MMKSLNNFTIRTRIINAFAFVTLISALVIITTGYYYYNALVARDQAVKISFTAQQTANVQQVSLQRMNALLQTRYAQVFATTGGTIADPSLEASGALINSDIFAREDNFNQTLQTYQQDFTFASPNMAGIRAIVLSDDPHSTISDTQQNALRAVAGSEWPRYKALQDQELRLLDKSTNPLLTTDPHLAYANTYPILYEANQIFLTLKLDWQHIVDVSLTIGEVVTNVGPSQTQPIVQATLIALALTLLVLFFVALLINLTVTRPLGSLVALTRRIGAGDLSARAPLWGRDEIYQVASSMNTMLDRIVKLIEASESQRASLQLQVEQLIHQVSGVGNGDLRGRATVTLQELGILADSFNFMIQTLSTLIRRVKGVAYEAASSTQHIAQSMNRLVSSAEQQITQIREASGEVERMASASLHVAQNAIALSTVASEAREAAREGAQAAQVTIDGIARVNNTMQATAQKVQSMHEHSSVIDETSLAMGRLAQQMQRLSLDAAILAGLSKGNNNGFTATEGNNNGFTAIVTTIRKLAEQAKEDSLRIGQIARVVIDEIAEVQRTTLTTAHEMDTMAGSAAQTGKALAAAVAAVERQANGIQEMSQVASTQVQSSRQVVKVMQHVSQVTGQNRSVIQEVVHQIQGQNRYIMQLCTSVEVFRISDEQMNASSHEHYAIPSGKLN